MEKGGEEVRRKIWKLPLIVWFIIGMVCTSIVTAVVVYTITQQAKVTVEIAQPGEYSFKIFDEADEEMTGTTIDFGTILRGSSKYVEIYVENNGTGTVTLTNLRDDCPVGYVAFNIGDATISPGQRCRVGMRLHISDTSEEGTYTFNIYIDAVA